MKTISNYPLVRLPLRYQLALSLSSRGEWPFAPTVCSIYRWESRVFLVEQHREDVNTTLKLYHVWFNTYKSINNEGGVKREEEKALKYKEEQVFFITNYPDMILLRY
ncbi:hypothetical protein AFK68_31645 [Hydrocoleum sp. CS-953]|uniref:hypothetical protein n=1 Tax=Hydrocoleum sp. CS-953 TaxID=1671698 RepID=UPI000B9C22E6|nr:hypothetical protein [Hydrocoleum sp. CS-953]OZH51340.1 hypothetical protein AFK68_31645 [Hydrocoleum sp. CS-953]